jgi:hypothetical protein
MKLNNEIIALLTGSRDMRLALCSALGFTELWIDKLIEKNKVNGPLTTAKSLEVIRKETGRADANILSEELETEAQK